MNRAPYPHPLRPAVAGFVLPAVLFALVVLTVLASASMRMASDERQAARAIRESGAALAAAQGGIVVAFSEEDPYRSSSDWCGDDEADDDDDDDDGAEPCWLAFPVKARRPSVDSVAKALAPGQSYDFGWDALADGGSFHASLRRCDNGGQPMYTLSITGRAARPMKGSRRLRLFLTSGGSFPSGSVLVDGALNVSGNPTLSGPCAHLHANGYLVVSGTLTTDGGVSAGGAAVVPGTIRDGSGAPVAAESFADSVAIPTLDPQDYCGDADFFFRNGWVVEAATGDSVNAAASTSHGWKYSGGTYTTDNPSVSSGTVCADGNLEVAHDLGSPGAPLALTLLTTGSVSIPANPYIVADHEEGVIIIASGDVKLSGAPVGSRDTYAGTVYAGSQCELSGTPSLAGQLLCKDAPNPPGSMDWVTENKINGDATLEAACTSDGAAGVRPLASRAWHEVW